MSNPLTFEDALEIAWHRIRNTLIERQRKYGVENISRHGEFGVLVRLDDKLARLGNQEEHHDESREDTWVDVAGYGIIGLMVNRKIWGLPLA